MHQKAPKQKARKSVKSDTGGSQRQSLELFLEGLAVQEIAARRNLAMSTVESHLAEFVRKGELDIRDVVPDSKRVQTIIEAVEKAGGYAVGPIKEWLGESFGYGEIRMVMNYYFWLQEQS